MNIFGPVIFTQERRQEEEKRGSFTLEQNTICSQTKLGDIVHEQTISASSYLQVT